MSGRVCIIDGCGRKHNAGGYCLNHWRRLKEVWRSPRRSGPRGRPTRVEGRNRFMIAHRLAYEVFVGPIPEGYEVDHVCHTQDESLPRWPDLSAPGLHQPPNTSSPFPRWRTSCAAFAAQAVGLEEVRDAEFPSASAPVPFTGTRPATPAAPAPARSPS